MIKPPSLPVQAKAILMEGPPGTGKTSGAWLIAQDLGFAVTPVEFGEMSKLEQVCMLTRELVDAHI